MKNSYYPWNVQALVDWLKIELKCQNNIRVLANAMSIPPSAIQIWLTSAVPDITLEQLRSIALYRGWSVQQTIVWLDLKPAHIESLLNRAN